MKAALTVRAWLELLHIDLIARGGFSAIRDRVVNTPMPATAGDPAIVANVERALSHARAWYFKSPKCLQYSAASTRLLRRRGIPARMVVGCQHAPFTAHAWVEVDGNVVSEYRYGLEHYQILDRW